jgi:hypothetical protein
VAPAGAGAMKNWVGPIGTICGGLLDIAALQPLLGSVMIYVKIIT